MCRSTGSGCASCLCHEVCFCLYCIAKLVREIVCICLTLIGTASSQPGPLRLKEFSQRSGVRQQGSLEAQGQPQRRMLSSLNTNWTMLIWESMYKYVNVTARQWSARSCLTSPEIGRVVFTEGSWWGFGWEWRRRNFLSAPKEIT